jgi:hypothetical protein
VDRTRLVARLPSRGPSGTVTAGECCIARDRLMRSAVVEFLRTTGCSGSIASGRTERQQFLGLLRYRSAAAATASPHRTGFVVLAMPVASAVLLKPVADGAATDGPDRLPFGRQAGFPVGPRLQALTHGVGALLGELLWQLASAD